MKSCHLEHTDSEIHEKVTKEFEKFKEKYKNKKQDFCFAVLVRENFVAFFQDDKVLFLPQKKLKELIFELIELDKNLKMFNFLKNIKNCKDEKGDKEQ